MLNQLKELELHDQSVNSFKIDFLKREMIFDVDVFDNKKFDFVNINLIFKEIENLKFESFEDYDDLEIYSSDFNISDFGYNAKFIF